MKARKRARERRQKRSLSAKDRAGKNHGLVTMKRSMKTLGARALDGRLAVVKALNEWKGELVDDLGGSVSSQQLAVIDLAVKTKLLLDSVDAYLLQLPSLVHKRRRQLYPIVTQRQQLADALARYLGQLGLERRDKQTASIESYFKERKEQAGGDPS